MKKQNLMPEEKRDVLERMLIIAKEYSPEDVQTILKELQKVLEEDNE